jgi:hypothetical protein
MTDIEIAKAYGVCPQCGALCKMRERRLNGDDHCRNGHVYPSRDAVPYARQALPITEGPSKGGQNPPNPSPRRPPPPMGSGDQEAP